MSIPFIISTIFFPLIGYVVDKIGNRINIFLLSGVLLILGYFLFLFLYPLIPLILIGIFLIIFT